METIPDTSNYMIAGFIVSFVTMGIYVISMYIRNKNLQRDLETLEEMDTEKK
ncbi:MAG: LapA family protein [Chloroflexi bacterium]|nr:LapA family protein [Chloroflexota bacterium]